MAATAATAQESARASAQAWFLHCEEQRALREQYDVQAEEDWKNYCFNETLARQSFEERLPYIDGLARDVQSRRATLTIGTSVEVLNVYDNGCVCTVVLSGPFAGEVHYLAQGDLQDPFWVKEEPEVLSTSVTMFIGVDAVPARAGNNKEVALLKGEKVEVITAFLGGQVTIKNGRGWIATTRIDDLVEAAA